MHQSVFVSTWNQAKRSIPPNLAARRKYHRFHLVESLKVELVLIQVELFLGLVKTLQLYFSDHVTSNVFIHTSRTVEKLEGEERLVFCVDEVIKCFQTRRALQRQCFVTEPGSPIFPSGELAKEMQIKGTGTYEIMCGFKSFAFSNISTLASKLSSLNKGRSPRPLVRPFCFLLTLKIRIIIERVKFVGVRRTRASSSCA